MSSLTEFMKENLNETIWVLLPGGLIFGKLHDIQTNDMTIGVVSAFHLAGQSKYALGDIAVHLDHISAWGLDEPTLEKEKDD